MNTFFSFLGGISRKALRKPGMLLVAVLALLVPGSAHATGLVDLILGTGVQVVLGPIYQLISASMFAVSWFISLLIGFVVAILGWFMEILLLINLNIVNSTPVKTGFPVVLSIANLLFVFGIIIIAVATILRLESYGMKKRLLTLIVMAVLINFGLVFAGVILNFSDSISIYFVQSVTPETATGTGTAGGPLVLSDPRAAQPELSSFQDFASTFAGAFQPQANFFWGQVGKLVKNPTDIRALSEAVTRIDNQSLMTPIAGMLMSVISLLTIVVVLGGLVIMLLVRYVKLSLILVMLPLAWISYAIPGLSKYFNKWWDNFIKQAFSIPMVVFFLWLAMKVAESMANPGSNDEFNNALAQINGGGLGEGIDKMMGSLFTPNLELFARTLILASIALAGLVAASKLGAAGADVAMNGVEGAKHWGAKKASQYTKRGMAAAYQKAGIKKTGEALMQKPSGWGSATGVGNKMLNVLGERMVAAGKPFTKKMVDEAKTHLKDSGSAELVKKLSGGLLHLEETLAAMAILMEKGDFHLIQKINGQAPEAWIEANKDAFGRFSQKALQDKIDTETLLAKDMRPVLLNINPDGYFEPSKFNSEIQGTVKWLKREELKKNLMTRGAFDGYFKLNGKVPYGKDDKQMMQIVVGIMDAIIAKGTSKQVSNLLGEMNENTDLASMFRDLLVTRANEWAATNGLGTAAWKDKLEKFLESDKVGKIGNLVLHGGKGTRNLDLDIDSLEKHALVQKGDRKSIGGWDTSNPALNAP